MISLALVGIPAAAMGATFPIAADWYADARDPTPPASSTPPTRRGAAAGAIAAGFCLIPALGLRAHDVGRRAR